MLSTKVSEKSRYLDENSIYTWPNAKEEQVRKLTSVQIIPAPDPSVSHQTDKFLVQRFLAATQWHVAKKKSPQLEEEVKSASKHVIKDNGSYIM